MSSWKIVNISLPLICPIQFLFLLRIIFKSVLFHFTVTTTFVLARFINPFCFLYFSPYRNFKTSILSLSFPPIAHVSHSRSSLISFHSAALPQLFCGRIDYCFVTNFFFIKCFAGRFFNLFWKLTSCFLLQYSASFFALNNLSVGILFFQDLGMLPVSVNIKQ